MVDKKVFIICGPTASGKSAVAMDMALANNGVIINADSQQVYKELPILTACPTKEDYAKIPHKLYQFNSGTDRMSVAVWVELAVKEINNAFECGKTPFVVGGTGFYIKALTEGLSVIPNIPENIRVLVRKEARYAKNSDLFEILKKYDMDLAKKISSSDRQRILRGIEVFRATGTPLSVWQRQSKIKPMPDVNFEFKIVNFEMPELERRIQNRTKLMFENGVVEEVVNLFALGYSENAPVFKVIGVETIKKYIDGVISKDEMLKEIVLLTRQYAKRQRTFFRTQFPNFL